jgi:hypothetical protein
VKLAKSNHIDWQAASAWITGDYNNATGEYRVYACQFLRENLVPVVPYFFIGKILGIDKGTVKYHYKRYPTLETELGPYPSLKRQKTKPWRQI